MLAAETAASLATEHPDYAVLAARIVASNLHKETKKVSVRIWLKQWFTLTLMLKQLTNKILWWYGRNQGFKNKYSKLIY